MDARKITAGLVIGAGLAALGYAGWSAYRRRGSLLGDALVDTRGIPRPPVVSQRRYGDKTITHYRGDIPINQRVKLIQERVYNSITGSPWAREKVAEITRHCKSRDNMCEAQAIYSAVRKHVRYTGDVGPIKFPDGTVEPIDYFQSAKRTWDMGMGDCDDHVALIAVLLSVIGITARLRVTAPSKRGDWEHIYPIAGLPAHSPRKWYALDTTLEFPTKFGSEVSYGKKQDYPA
jgi:transglutaminase-like putative cysteine protease